METSSSSPPPSPQYDGGMEIHHPPAATEWDWGDLLDFTVEDHFPISFDTVADVTQTMNDLPPIETQQVQVQVPAASDRVRKRDPRLSCSNFLAGRVPCACPEMDAKLLEEEEALPGKKRPKMTRAGSGISRCQVPGCEADISELKGYHKRHRVCLRCANASTVSLDGVTKRYCQQCGKFHVLSDFDEGKRSCRRKLERHNNRRRRKAVDSCKGSAVDKEAQGDLLTEDNTCDDEAGKDGLRTTGLIEEKEGLVESEDGHAATINSDPNSQNVNSDSGVSFAASGEIQLDGGKDDSKLSFSPSHCENKSAYSSMCPTGRISFKLYDWNPAEFPRRLRHQIFQWLASMPVELEGYIRPGCTILTAFIAMPTFMWVKLFEDPVSYLHDILDYGKVLSKKGRMLVYLNNMVFNVTKDGTSVTKVNGEAHAPRLHYVHPSYFEAGKPLEFVVCGSNLLQPKFRFLVSFAGKYLAHDYCVELPQMHAKRGSGLHHQLYKIVTRCVEPNHFGPAFIEVENESGLSNFIPVLIGDREMCSEIETIQQRVDASHSSRVSLCEVFTARQMAFSEFIVDIAWILKEPSVENSQQIMTSSQIQRLISVLNFLSHHESTTILDKILQNLKTIIDKRKVSGVASVTGDAGMRQLQKYMDYASDILCKKHKRSEGLKLQLEDAALEKECISRSCRGINMQSVPPTSENLEQRPHGELGVMANSNSIGRSDEVPLLNRDIIMSVNLIEERPTKRCGLILSNRVLKYRPMIFVVAIVAVCFGACAVLLHPYKVSKLAVSIRRCLTDG